MPLRDDVLLIPGIQVLCWVDTAILPSGDPEDQRPVVVMMMMAVPRRPESLCELWAPGSIRRTGSHDDHNFAAAFARFP